MKPTSMPFWLPAAALFGPLAIAFGYLTPIGRYGPLALGMFGALATGFANFFFLRRIMYLSAQVDKLSAEQKLP